METVIHQAGADRFNPVNEQLNAGYEWCLDGE